MALFLINKDLDVAIDLSEGVQHDGYYSTVIVHTPNPAPKRSLDRLIKALKDTDLDLGIYPDSTLRIYISDSNDPKMIVDRYTKILQLFTLGNSELVYKYKHDY